MMLALASLSLLLADGTRAFTPEEPATLPMVLVALGTLAVYGILTGWRLRRATFAVDSASTAEHAQATADMHDRSVKCAA